MDVVNYEWFFPIACLAIALLLLNGNKKKSKYQKNKQRHWLVRVIVWLWNYGDDNVVGRAPSQKAIDDLYYHDKRWSTLSWKIKQKYGFKCMACGKSYAKHGVVMNTDHIYPVRYYWHLRYKWWNLQVLCEECNKGKGSSDLTDFRGLCLGRILLKIFHGQKVKR